MKKVLSVIGGRHTIYRPNHLAEGYVEWELALYPHGPEFSASASTTYFGHGQVIGEVAKAFPQDELLQRIAKVWRQYHLNGMKAGTPEQEAAVKDYFDDSGRRYDFTEACRELSLRGLYEVPVDTTVMHCTGDWPEEVRQGKRGYRYGERWVYSGIPADVIAEVRSWKGDVE